MSELKKFTKGCAVDVRGWDKLPYGEVMFEAIKRVGEGVDNGHFGKYDKVGFSSIENEWMCLCIDGGKYSLGTADHFKMMLPLTPTDILGEQLVKAIEDGYAPYFKGDLVSCTRADIVLANGVRSSNNDIIYAINTSSIIAYKPIKQPSIESKTLSEKVGPNILSMSIEDLVTIKEVYDGIARLTATEEAKAANLPYIQGIIDQLRG